MSSYKRRPTPGNTDWFVHDRFGMFIHFGLYALPARHEWVQMRECIPAEEYEKRYFGQFNPDLFDAKEWARYAKEAGMKYAVLTTRHHEGFSLFDTAYSDYKITNTPFGRDLVKEYVEAFRAEGLKVGFYYSLLDWHHPDYTIDRNHPLRNHPDALKMNETRDMKRYAAFMRNQVTELLSNYGKIDILWFDFSFPTKADKYPHLAGKGKDDWEAEKLIALARSLQPEILIDDRTGIEQDLTTPEQYQAEEWPRHKETGEYLTWEACQTFSGSWGYHRDESTWKSPEMLIEMLIKTVSLGGNLLMNVGPCARGYFDSRAVAALKVYGEWMRYNARSIYGCTMAEPEFEAPQGTLLTQSEDGSRLYVHLLSYPFKRLSMKGLAERIEYAQFLNDASEIRYTVQHETVSGDVGGLLSGKDMVFFSLPVVRPSVTVPVIEIFLKPKS